MGPQAMTTNGNSARIGGVPEGGRLIPVARTQATALRALVSEMKQVQDSLAWLASQIAADAGADVAGMKCAGVHDEGGQICLIYMPDEADIRHREAH